MYCNTCGKTYLTVHAEAGRLAKQGETVYVLTVVPEGVKFSSLHLSEAVEAFNTRAMRTGPKLAYALAHLPYTLK